MCFDAQYQPPGEIPYLYYNKIAVVFFKNYPVFILQLPELLENFRQNPSLKTAIASNLGIFFGFLVMFLMAVFEEQIQF